MQYGRWMVFLCVIFTLFAGAVQAEALMVEGAWVRAAPPAARVTSGYLVLNNHGGQRRTLVAVSSPRFARVELHRTVIREGMATMQPLAEMKVPAGGTVRFAPGDLHLMLMEGVSPIEEGGHVPLNLTFKNGEVVSVDAPVRRGTPSGHDHGDGHTMHH